MIKKIAGLKYKKWRVEMKIKNLRETVRGLAFIVVRRARIFKVLPSISKRIPYISLKISLILICH